MQSIPAFRNKHPQAWIAIRYFQHCACSNPEATTRYTLPEPGTAELNQDKQNKGRAEAEKEKDQQKSACNADVGLNLFCQPAVSQNLITSLWNPAWSGQMVVSQCMFAERIYPIAFNSVHVLNASDEDLQNLWDANIAVTRPLAQWWLSPRQLHPQSGNWLAWAFCCSLWFDMSAASESTRARCKKQSCKTGSS